MYHYVREYDSKYPNFRFLDIKNFSKQLDFFEKNYGFVDFDEWESYVMKGIMPDTKGKVILTFDDAMSCHFSYVFDELIKRNLWGIFYVPTSPYINKKILDVHRIHLLCGAFEGKDLIYTLESIIDEKMIPDNKIIDFKRTYTDQKNLFGISDFKRILNYYISYDYRTKVIDDIAGKFSYSFDVDNFYVKLNDLKKMINGGMIIGSHTENHPLMSKLNKNEQSKEISNSFDFLLNSKLVKHKTYCHPYGGFHSFNNHTIDLLNENNVKYSFNVEAREITKNDLKSSTHYLPRFDCNLFQYGLTS